MRQQRLKLAQARLDFARFAAITLHGVERLQSVAGDADDGGRIARDFPGRNEFLRHAHGHTAGGLKLNLLPAGVVVRDAAHLCIGAGVVADPRKIWWETRPLEQKGHAILSRLVIDERTLVSDLTHRLLDLAWEDYRTNVLHEEPRGSTGRGITPAYGDEIAQWQICFSDFQAGPNSFARKLAQRADRALHTIRHVCRVSEETWTGFFKKLTEAEQRSNRESIEQGIFPAEEFDVTRFLGREPFTLELDRLAETYWRAGTALARHIGEVRELVLDTTTPLDALNRIARWKQLLHE